MRELGYTYYTMNYGGTSVKNLEFYSIMKKAKAYLRYILMRDYDVEDTNIKNALCALCDVFKNYMGRYGVRSESNDKVCITYNDMTFYDYAMDAVKVYLSGTNYLYRGGRG